MQNEPKAHHFVPQLLLRGFASRTKGSGRKKRTFVWQFMKGIDPHEPNIRGVGQSHHFHGSDSSLEKQIATFESEFGHLVGELRATCVVSESQFPVLLKFVAHLMIRTRNLREGSAAVGPALFDGIKEYFLEAPNRRALVERLEPKIRETLSKEPMFRMLCALGFSEQGLLELGMSMLSSAPIEDFVTATLDEMRGRPDFDTVARNVHLKALTGEEAIQNRLATLGALHWVLFSFEPHSLILGDGIVVARRVNGKFDLPLLVQPSYYEIAVPIAHDVLLFGSAGCPERPDPAVINNASAATSREWFVASQRTVVEEHLHREALGTRSSFIRDGDVRTLFETNRWPSE